MPSFSLSRHAETRSRQRGVSHTLIEALIQFADMEGPAGCNCTFLRVSRKGLSDPVLRERIGGDIDRLGSLALVLGEDGEIVTVLHDRGGSGGRRYRPAH
jgi:hypothetical protein